MSEALELVRDVKALAMSLKATAGNRAPLRADYIDEKFGALEAAIEKLERERDEALADNAVLMEYVKDAAERLLAISALSPNETEATLSYTGWKNYEDTLAQPHPGASLLTELAELREYKAARDGRATTHSEVCWKWHLDCAVSQVERLRAAVERMDAEMRYVDETSNDGPCGAAVRNVVSGIREARDRAALNPPKEAK